MCLGQEKGAIWSLSSPHTVLALLHTWINNPLIWHALCKSESTHWPHSLLKPEWSSEWIAIKVHAQLKRGNGCRSNTVDPVAVGKKNPSITSRTEPSLFKRVGVLLPYNCNHIKVCEKDTYIYISLSERSKKMLCKFCCLNVIKYSKNKQVMLTGLYEDNLPSPAKVLHQNKYEYSPDSQFIKWRVTQTSFIMSLYINGIWQGLCVCVCVSSGETAKKIMTNDCI